MRLALSLALLAGSVALAQERPTVTGPPPPRFGVRVKLKAYPQDTPRKALASAVEAIDTGDAPYLVAHLLDPGFVELRLADRAKQFEAPVELELTRLRDTQNA